MKTFKSFTPAITLLLLMMLTGMSACKKDSSTSSDELSKVLGKWTYVSQTMSITLPGSPKETVTIDAMTGDYIEFSSGGKATIVLMGQKMEAPYKVEGSSKITFSGQSGTITTLNDKSFQFGTKVSANGTSTELTYVLKK